MSYLDDPSVLTKDKLKSELLAHNVELPAGNPTKDVYVQLYLKNLTAHNKNHAAAATPDVFSSDEELPPPVVFSRSRSSGRKATRKTDKVRPDEMDVTMLTDEGLKDELLKHGVDVGPVVASTRKLYEKKLQRMLDNGPAQPPLLVLTEIQVNHNGNSESDLYSDKEDEVTAEPEPVPEPEPVAEPEPTPVVERLVRSRGKTPVTTRTRSSQHHTLKVEDVGLSVPKPNQDSCHQPAALLNTALLEVGSLTCTKPSPRPAARPSRPSSPLAQITKVDPVTFSPLCNISPIKRREYHWPLSDRSGSKAGSVSVARVEKIAASDQTPKVVENDVLKELFPNDINSPTGISATCRRPIRGAARRPVASSDLWNDENFVFSPKTTKTTSSSSYTESCTVNRVSSLPPSTPSSSSYLSSSSRLLSAAPPAGQTKAAYRSVSLWIKFFLLAIVAAFLFLVYQAMETNTINPFTASDTEVAGGSTA
ncbi:thymopoietin a isoform X2 [Anoplopoma fimbria]|uniref:thymopoietin a isoform X2 n=1 Tax=Anoplopoma fimbria TaxID=229290 RepID=UPI0023ECEDE8|nr:thymopoietin a isoform X2 [Anoplopoma fimbria]